jgi:PelA/Pel-15E family pectate lyase
MARSYELPSLSGCESVPVVQFLMGIEAPPPAVVEAIEGAAAWFEEAKLTGIRKEWVEDPALERGGDKVIVEDPDAPPIWARFYEIGTNKPIYCSRDGIPRESLMDISYERRTGYTWLGFWPRDLLEMDYPAWKKRVGGEPE